MTPNVDEIDWSLTTWEGSRRAQLRQWRQLTLRERLIAVEAMGEMAERFRVMRETGKLRRADVSRESNAEEDTNPPVA